MIHALGRRKKMAGALTDKILDTVKSKVWIDASYDDPQVITNLVDDTNTVLMALNQMGIGNDGFRITSTGNEKWEDFLKDSQQDLDAIKTYVGLRVEMLFNPPTSSLLKEAKLEAIREAEFRLFIHDNYNDPVVTDSHK